ncbi:MAG: hypothetical protein SNJ69_06850 [Chloroflexaceae bacterium]
MFALGVIIAIGSAIAFAILGALVLWGGWVTTSREIPVHFVSAGASSGARIATLLMVGLPVLVTGVFGLLAGWRILMVALGLG